MSSTLCCDRTSFACWSDTLLKQYDTTTRLSLRNAIITMGSKSLFSATHSVVEWHCFYRDPTRTASPSRANIRLRESIVDMTGYRDSQSESSSLSWHQQHIAYTYTYHIFSEKQNLHGKAYTHIPYGDIHTTSHFSSNKFDGKRWTDRLLPASSGLFQDTKADFKFKYEIPG